MKHSGLFWKGLLGLFLLVAFVLLGSLGWIGREYRRHLTRDLERSLQQGSGRILTRLRAVRGDTGLAPLRSRLSKLLEGNELQVFLLDSEGRVLLDSAELPEGGPRILHPDQLESAPERSLSGFRRTGPGGESVLSVVRPLDTAAPGDGYLYVSTSFDWVRERMNRFYWSAATGATVVFSVVLVLGYLGLRRLFEPIDRLRDKLRVALDPGQGPMPEGEFFGDELTEVLRQHREQIDRVRARRDDALNMLNGMDLGLIGVDGEVRVFYMNDSAADLLDVPVEEAVDRPLWEITQVEVINRTVSDALERGEAVRREHRFHGDTTETVVECRARPLPGHRKNREGVLLILRDVSELRRLQTVRQDFIANLSHELKTPLTALRGVVETLLEDPGMKPETRNRFLEKINHQTERMSSLVGDLLTLSRLESDRDTISERPVDLRKPAREATRLLGDAARVKDQDLKVQLPDSPLVVRGDQETIQQMISNLVDNAIKYTPKGGDITVRARRSHHDAVLEVRDSGMGIEPREQERIFERFYRVDRTRTRRLGGTGLGLSIVKHICLSLDGDVSVESVPGKGSTFRVVLPLAEERDETRPG